jgi:hypothetical protein
MRAFHELLVPELSRQDSDDCLILSEPGDESGTAATNESGDRARRENSNPPQRVGRQVVGNPLG